MSNNDFEPILARLNEITARLLLNLPDRAREIGFLEKLLKRRASLLVGPRGCGKTTLLLMALSKNSNYAYFSLDNPLFSGMDPYLFFCWVCEQGYEGIVLDEVHYLQNWSQILKSLYDSYPKIKFIATDSSSLILKSGVADLSRRFVTEHLSFLSFREYLYLKYGFQFDSISIKDLSGPAAEKKINSLYKSVGARKLNLIKEFKEYLRTGTRPYFLEGDAELKTMNVVEKIIYSDVPHFLPEIKERHLQLMKNILADLSSNPVPTLNIDSMAKNWAISKNTVYNLLEVLQMTDLIQVIAVEKSIGKTKGRKIFFSDPTLYHVFAGNLGNLRESFFAFSFRRIQLKVECPKADDHYDFSVNKMTFEVGGRSKKRKSAEILIRDDQELASKNVFPLWSLGFLESST